MTQLLTKEQILAVDDIKIQSIEVPEWGGSVRVRQFSGNSRSALMRSIEDTKKNTGNDITLPDLKITVCGLAIVDDKGARLFSNDEMKLLGDKSAAALDRIYAAAEKLNAISEEASKEIEKN